MLPFIFLDRDGTLVEDTGYLRDPSTVDLLPLVVQGLREMRRKGYRLFVVSNQSGVGRGIITDEQFTAVHNRILECLNRESLELDGFAYCLHRPNDNCGCRKPKSGLVPKMWNGNPIDFSNSFVVGDRLADIDLGLALGCQSCLVLTGVGRTTRDALLQSPPPFRWRAFENLDEFSKDIPMLKT